MCVVGWEGESGLWYRLGRQPERGRQGRGRDRVPHRPTKLSLAAVPLGLLFLHGLATGLLDFVWHGALLVPWKLGCVHTAGLAFLATAVLAVVVLCHTSSADADARTALALRVLALPSRAQRAFLQRWNLRRSCVCPPSTPPPPPTPHPHTFPDRCSHSIHGKGPC